MTVEKGNFIEIDFTGIIKSTDAIFDTTRPSEAKAAKLPEKNLRPFILSAGNGMLPVGLDEELIGKEVGKEYTVEIAPEKAFGKRQSNLVKMIPTKLFLQQKINPQRGMQLNLDGQTVTIMSSSSGRTLVDFNTPLAGKDLIYKYKINKEVTDENEKINALQDFLFRQRFKYEIKDKVITCEIPKAYEPLIKMFSDKFKELLGYELAVKIIEEKAQETK
jgi:FKBP-type peptidyl-prolyl cis-trans isomerase 2